MLSRWGVMWANLRFRAELLQVKGKSHLERRTPGRSSGSLYHPALVFLEASLGFSVGIRFDCE